MNDNALIKIIKAALDMGFTALSLGQAVIVKQKYQPTQQGTNTKPTVYLFKISDKRYGFPEKTDVWNADDSKFIHTESQWYETQFQISALVKQDPKNVNSLTASDIVNYAAYIMQNDAIINYLLQHNVGIERITAIRNVPFVDDKDQFEYNPSFDFTLTHRQILISTVPVASTELTINRV